MNPEIDRHRHHCNNDNQNDEQRSYLCSSAIDHVKHNHVCDSNNDGSDNKSPHKEVDHGFIPSSVLIVDLKTVSDSLVA